MGPERWVAASPVGPLVWGWGFVLSGVMDHSGFPLGSGAPTLGAGGVGRAQPAQGPAQCWRRCLWGCVLSDRFNYGSTGHCFPLIMQ